MHYIKLHQIRNSINIYEYDINIKTDALQC